MSPESERSAREQERRATATQESSAPVGQPSPKPSTRLDTTAEDRAVLVVTAGRCANYPDWPEWLDGVRGAGAADRLTELGR